MNKTIVSFGDSFVYGSEIPGNHDGSLAWPGLVAQLIGTDYKTFAKPGCGNDAIARQIYSYFSHHDSNDTLAVINWTWSLRWDFYMANSETWITLGPTCVPEKLKNLVDLTQAKRVVDFYHDYANKSLLWNKFRSLQTIFAVQKFLESKNIISIQTYMDDHLFNTEFHCPDYVKILQDQVSVHMDTWQGKTFLEWCCDQGFPITQTLHPVGDAHKVAADFWKDRYAQALER